MLRGELAHMVWFSHSSTDVQDQRFGKCRGITSHVHRRKSVTFQAAADIRAMGLDLETGHLTPVLYNVNPCFVIVIVKTTNSELLSNDQNLLAF